MRKSEAALLLRRLHIVARSRQRAQSELQFLVVGRSGKKPHEHLVDQLSVVVAYDVRLPDAARVAGKD